MTNIEQEVRAVRLDHLLGVYRVGSHEWSWHDEYDDLIHRPVTQQLLAEVKRDGITEPILLGTDGRVWDGHHRITVAMHLGLDTVPVEFAGASRPATRETAPPAYLALDLWMALGADSREFDGYYDRNGWANTWSNLLEAVRARSGRVTCPIWQDGEPCVLVDGHIGPHMGYSDVGSSEPLPLTEQPAATRETVTEEMVERAARAYWRKSMEDVGIDLDDWEESEREQYMWAARVVLEAALTEKGDDRDT